MCPDSLNWALWVRFHGRFYYQSFIDGPNIWGVDGTDPWGPEMDHPPLGRNYLVVVPSHDMPCALILLTGPHGCDSMIDIDINPSSIGPIFRVWIGPILAVLKWTIPHWAAAVCSSAVVWYVICPDSLIWALWWVSMVGIDIYPSWMGPIFGVWIGPTLGVPKWDIRHWAEAIW